MSIPVYGRIIDKEFGKSKEEHERIPHSNFDSYTSLNTSNKGILMECVNTEFKKVEIINPYPVIESV